MNIIIKNILQLILFLSLSNLSLDAKNISLSARTLKEFRILQEHVEDANERLLIADIFLLSIPFAKLLDGADIVTVIDIGTTDWISIGNASQALHKYTRNQLRKFCQFEMLKQSNSSHDYKFWSKLADSFK